MPDSEPRHLVMVSATAGGLARAVGETHRQYTGFVNARARWTRHLFQGRFASVVLDEEHLMLAARYVVLNPARARLVQRRQDWAWSSLRAHLYGSDDGLVTVAPLLDRLGSVTALIDTGPEAEALACLDEFVTRLEGIVQRRLRRQQSGRKAKIKADAGDLFAGVDEGPMRRGNM